MVRLVGSAMAISGTAATPTPPPKPALEIPISNTAALTHVM